MISLDVNQMQHMHLASFKTHEDLSRVKMAKTWDLQPAWMSWEVRSRWSITYLRIEKTGGEEGKDWESVIVFFWGGEDSRS